MVAVTSDADPRVVDLASLVVAGDIASVAASCDAGAVAPDRTALIATCTKIIEKGFWSTPPYTADQVDAAAIAFTAHATLGAVSRMRRTWYIPRDLDLARRLVAARDETFRDGWVAHAVDSLDPRGVYVARRLVSSGCACKPASDMYTIALVAHPQSFDLTGNTFARGNTAVLDVLRANPDLLVEDVWRIFEVEGGGENSLAAHDKYCHETMSWQRALIELSNDGSLDRGRLLDASLDALQRGFAQFRAQWFSALHEALAPTPAERAVRSSVYLALTASPIGPTVSMALKALAQIEPPGAVDPVEVVAQIGPALLTPSKGGATQALRLLTKAVGTEPQLQGQAAATLVTALGHGAPDVQKAAFEQLRAWLPTPPQEVVTSARQLAPGCHPSVRADLEKWFGEATAASAPSPASSDANRPRREIRITEIDWLSSEHSLQPIDDRDDLFERTATALERPGAPDELEVVLASIAATGHAGIAGDRRATTLGRRAAKLSRSDRPSQRLVARLVLAWVDPEQLSNDASADVTGASTLDDLLLARLESVVRRVCRGEPCTLLASPTHSRGVIDPVTFAERLDVSGDPHPAELTTALLRLAPEPRRLNEARSALSGQRHRGARRWLEQWEEHCERDATRSGHWTCTSRTSPGGYTFHDLHLDGMESITPAGAPVEVTLRSGRWRRFAQDPAGVLWVGSIIPGLPAAWARLGASSIGPTYGPRDVSHGDPAYLERFFDHAAPLGDDAYLLLALSLDDQRASVRTVATDVVIGALEDGRLDPASVGRQIGRLSSTGLVTPARWGQSLADVASAAPANRGAVMRCLEQAVAVAEPRKPQDLLPLLELLETLALESATQVTDAAARTSLTRITGTSKTAETAGRLLALETR